MKTRTAWVFPGQGCQEVGIEAELLELPIVKARLDVSRQILGWSVLELWRSRPSEMFRTLYTQPCLYVISSIFADLMMQQSQQPFLLAGYSLGEYVALYTAGVYSFESGLHLVKRRAELMDSAPDGAMVLLLGVEREQLERCLQSTPNVWFANDDPNKVIISGTKKAVEAVVAQVQPKRILQLSIDKPFHSPLMAHSAEEFRRDLESMHFELARIPVLSGLEPNSTVEPFVIKQHLLQQISQPVRWQVVSQQLVTQGIERVVEIGSGKFLGSLIRSTCPSLVVESCSFVAQLNQFSRELVKAR